MFIVAVACVVGFAANAFGLQSWLVIAALCLAFLARPWGVGSGLSQTGFLLIVAFALLYWLTSTGSLLEMLPTFSYPAAYLLGFLLVAGGAEKAGRFVTVITAAVAGVTLHGLLNAGTNFQSYGWNLPGRVLPDYWTQQPLTATLQATLFTPLVGFTYYAVSYRAGRHLLRLVLTLAAALVAIGYNLATATRTIFVIGALTLGVCCIVGARQRLRGAAGLVLGASVAILFYTQDVFLVRSAVENSALSRRISETDAVILGDDPRLGRWQYIIDNFWENTAGGRQFRSLNGYAHNLWLDAYDAGGLAPLILLLFFSIAALALLRKMVRSPKIEVHIKFLVCGLWVAMLTQFMTEPILDGVPYLFALFCLAVGAGDALVNEPYRCRQESCDLSKDQRNAAAA